MAVAAGLGLSPTEFSALLDTDRAYLIAFIRAKNTMEAYEHYLSDKRSKMKATNRGPR